MALYSGAYDRARLGVRSMRTSPADQKPPRRRLQTFTSCRLGEVLNLRWCDIGVRPARARFRSDISAGATTEALPNLAVRIPLCLLGTLAEARRRTSSRVGTWSATTPNIAMFDQDLRNTAASLAIISQEHLPRG